jgi:hypothetical protein
LSKRCRSSAPASASSICGTVAPSPFGYCWLTTIGSFSRRAVSIKIREFFTTCSSTCCGIAGASRS